MKTRDLRFQLSERLRDACNQEAGLCNATIEERNWMQFVWEELDRQLEYDALVCGGLSDYEARETIWSKDSHHPKELNQQPNLQVEAKK
jgi:hypothetical protein